MQTQAVHEDALVWDPSFAVGVAPIDEDHQVLFRLVNRFGEALDEGAEPDDVGGVLADLAAYVDYHCVREEKALEAVDFPGRVAHAANHRDFHKTLTAHQEHFRRDPVSVDLAALHGFVRRWVLEHVVVDDRVLMDHAAGRPEAERAARAVRAPWE